jgi:hypothetical protein
MISQLHQMLLELVRWSDKANLSEALARALLPQIRTAD